jgi:hypothetical protein
VGQLKRPPLVHKIRWRRELLLAGFVLLALSYSWMFKKVSAPNERSRIYLTVAMVDRGTVQIDEEVRRFGRIFDLARRDGHYYSDKAPGSSLIAAPVYAVARQFRPADEWAIEDLLELFRRGLMIPIGLIGFLLLRLLLRHIRVEPAAADVISVAWILGSSAFHYSTAFFGHQIVAVALIGALLAVLRAEHVQEYDDDSKPPWVPIALAAAAGAACGIAGITEYQAGVPCVLIAAYVVLGPLRRNKTAILAFAAAALPFVAILLVYNTEAFGGPLSLSYDHLAHASSAAKHEQGIGGITSPTWEAFHGAFFSLHRGLFTTSPFFLLALVGLVHLGRERQWRMLALLGLNLGFWTLFISSSNMWYGGWGYGPRLLVPGMGLFAVLAAYGAHELLPRIWAQPLVRGLAIVGIAQHQVIQAFFPEPPESATNPIPDFVLPMIEKGVAAPNIMSHFGGLDGLASLVPLGVCIFALIIWVATTGLPYETSRHKVISVLGSLLVVLAFGAYVLGLVGTEWEPRKLDRFMKTVERWQKFEHPVEKDAHRAIDRIHRME